MDASSSGQPAHAVPTALIVSEDPFIRTGIKSALEGAALGVVGDADPEGWEEALADVEPEVVLWDGAGPEHERGGTFPPVIALVDDPDGARRALSSGASAALLRGGAIERLASAADAVRSGLIVLDDAFSDLLPGALGPGTLPSGEKLTPREEEVIELMAQGLSNREIAEELDVTVHTAKFHVNAILAKLGAQTRTEAVVLAARLGVLTL